MIKTIIFIGMLLVGFGAFMMYFLYEVYREIDE